MPSSDIEEVIDTIDVKVAYNTLAQAEQEIDFHPPILLSPLQKKVNWGLTLLAMASWSNLGGGLISNNAFPAKEMLAAGLAPIGKMAHEFMHYDFWSLCVFRIDTPDEQQKKAVITFSVGVITALLTGLGAGYLINSLDKHFSEKNVEITNELFSLLKEGMSSIAIASLLGYVASILTTMLLQKKYWIKKDFYEIENIPDARMYNRIVDTVLVYEMLRTAIIQTKQADFLCTPVAGLLTPSIDQLHNSLYTFVNKTITEDTIPVGPIGDSPDISNKNTVPVKPINDSPDIGNEDIVPVGPIGDSPDISHYDMVKVAAWYAERAACVLIVGYGVNATLEAMLDNKEDMSQSGRMCINALVSAAIVYAERIFDNPEPLKTRAKSILNGLYYTANQLSESTKKAYKKLNLFSERSSARIDKLIISGEVNDSLTLNLP